MTPADADASVHHQRLEAGKLMTSKQMKKPMHIWHPRLFPLTYPFAVLPVGKGRARTGYGR